MALKTFIQAWSGMRQLTALTDDERAIVFYAEGPGDWPHLGPVIQRVARQHPACYLTSDPEDPVAAAPPHGIRPFFIGQGLVRTLTFLRLRADVMVMTTPDLETFQLKRSRVDDVHYAYVFHSPVSTHMVYRPRAFDHYDTVLCAGPHQIPEIRSRETRLGLKPKVLLEHGYGRLDTLLTTPSAHRAAATERPRVLIAPSWGRDALLEAHGIALCGPLLAAGFDVIVRPHPMTSRQRPELLRQLDGAFGSLSNFTLDLDAASPQTLARADIMITDWSGAALDFALGFERPVLFIDVPRKINNPDYGDVPTEPLEVSIREKLGAVVAPDHIAALPQRVTAALEDVSRDAQVDQLRQQTVFNVGRSAEVGARHILQLADQAQARKARQHPPLAATVESTL